MARGAVYDKTRRQVLQRDGRCRMCGRTNDRLDVHHIRFRRSDADDDPANLITLCRDHHEDVHAYRIRYPTGDTVSKTELQEVMWQLVDQPGVTGFALLRRSKR